MTEFWETAFTEKQRMWGLVPTASAIFPRGRERAQASRQGEPQTLRAHRQQTP